MAKKCTGRSRTREDHTPLSFITTCDKILLPYIIYHKYFLIIIFFYIYITIDSIFYIFLNFFVIFIFVVSFLVQFRIILVRNGMFYENHKSSYLVNIFYCVIETMYIYSWKKLIKIWSILVMLYVKGRFLFFIFFIVRGVQLDNTLNPPWLRIFEIAIGMAVKMEKE